MTRTDRQSHENRILHLLAKKELHFNEIVRQTKFPRDTVNYILQALRSKGYVHKRKEGNRVIFSASDHGRTRAKNLWPLYYKIGELWSNMALYVQGPTVSLAGLDSVLIIPKNEELLGPRSSKPNFKPLLPKPDFNEFTNMILRQMLEYLIAEKLTIKDHINAEGILALQIDYSRLTEFLKQIDHNVLQKFIQDIENDIFPLEDPNIMDRLFYSIGRDKYHDDSRFYYIPAARALRYNDKEFLKKLNDYQTRAELHTIQLQIQKLTERQTNEKTN